MKIAGITAEYNPLHKGHVYHIEETRRQTGCDAVVVAMSGDFVQRGEPAILDKWLRAGHALKAGADLVVEIPALFCLGNASQYAHASVSMLESLGCDHISFGSESGDADAIAKVAEVLTSDRQVVDSHISAMIKEGKSYPAARAEAYRDLMAGKISDSDLEMELAILSDPNDILALEYIVNMKSALPLAVKRYGAYHGRGGSGSDGFESAERIRAMIRSNGAENASFAESVPGYVADTFGYYGPVFADGSMDILKYAILSADAEYIDECPSGGEGLGNLLKAAVKEADTYDELIMRVKSKRYTYTRISRLCMQVLLGITRRGYDLSGPRYIRVLGHSEKGREILSEVRKASKDAENNQGDAAKLQMLPVITNINKETDKLDKAGLDQLRLDIHASEIYRLIAPEGGEDHIEQRMRPVMV